MVAMLILEAGLQQFYTGKDHLVKHLFEAFTRQSDVDIKANGCYGKPPIAHVPLYFEAFHVHDKGRNKLPIDG